MARGNRRERIFRDEADRLLFYQTLGEACERTGWRVHAWVLMSNHYHLMVKTPEANLVAGMRWLQNPRRWAGSRRVVGQRTRFVARFRRAQGRLGKFDLRADGSEAELDCRQTGDAQRCKREPTSPPVPCPEIQVTTRFKKVSPVCQDLLTDPYVPMPMFLCYLCYTSRPTMFRVISEQ
jgi:REP element-mobilizing transposase RayT